MESLQAQQVVILWLVISEHFAETFSSIDGCTWTARWKHSHSSRWVLGYHQYTKV